MRKNAEAGKECVKGENDKSRDSQLRREKLKKSRKKNRRRRQEKSKEEWKEMKIKWKVLEVKVQVPKREKSSDN